MHETNAHTNCDTLTTDEKCSLVINILTFDCCRGGGGAAAALCQVFKTGPTSSIQHWSVTELGSTRPCSWHVCSKTTMPEIHKPDHTRRADFYLPQAKFYNFIAPFYDTPLFPPSPILRKPPAQSHPGFCIRVASSWKKSVPNALVVLLSLVHN